MAEEIASADGVIEDGQPVEAVSDETQNAEPKSEDQGKDGKENLSVAEINIRRLQSTYDRKIAEMQRQIEQERLRNIPEDQREVEQLRMEVERLRGENAEYQQFRVLNEISSAYNVPLDALNGATSTVHAQQLALDYLSSRFSGSKGTTGQMAGASPQPPATPGEHTPFVAPAKAATPTERDFNAELDEALAAKDQRAYNRIMREMQEASAS